MQRRSRRSATLPRHARPHADTCFPDASRRSRESATYRATRAPMPEMTQSGCQTKNLFSASKFVPKVPAVCEARIKLIDADFSANLRKEVSQHLQYFDPAASD